MKAYGPGLQSTGLAVGKPAEFTVDAKLGGKAPLKIQAQVCIRILFLCLNIIVYRRIMGFFSPPPCQDRDGNPVDVQVKDNGNGTYSCSYTPRKPVKHTVMVSWGGVNIPESPFRVSPCGNQLRHFYTEDRIVQSLKINK